MTKLDVAKKVAKVIVGASTAYTVKTVLSSNADTQKPYQQAEVYVGSYAIGAIVAKQTENLVDEKIDALHGFYKKIAKKKTQS